MAEVEAALARVESQLGAADFELFRRLVDTLVAVMAILNSSRAMLSRLRRLFGLQSSEKSRDVLGDQAGAAAAELPSTNASDGGAAFAPDNESPPNEEPKGHG